MSKFRRTAHHRRRGRSTLGPEGTLDLAVATLQSALTLASPSQTPAIARQLLAAAREREAALARADALTLQARRDAAEAKREKEIGVLVNLLGIIYPQRPANWGACSTREIAETMHEEGLTGELLTLARMAEEDSRTKFPEGVVPDDYWESRGAYARLEGEDEEEGEEEENDERRGRDDPGMRRLHIP